MVRACLLVLLSTAFLSTAQVVPGENKDVVDGQSLRLQCRFNFALASRNLLYYWIRINKVGSDNAAISENALDPHYKVDFNPNEGRYDFIISKAQYEKDNGQFECKLKEGGTGVDIYSQTFVVTVLIPPGPPVISPPNPVAREGEPFTLTCSSEGGSPDPLIQWYRGSVTMQSQLKKGGSRDIPTTATLTINPGLHDQGAMYKCVVWNRAIPEEQRLESAIKMAVQYSPRVAVGPYNPLSVLSKSDAHLTCSVNASPPVRSVRWMKNGHLLSHHYNHTILAVTPDDSGIYSCVADNGIGDATQADLDLSVLFGPQVNLIAEKDAALGEMLNVKCNVAANPPPHFLQWTKEGDPFFKQTGHTLRIESISVDDVGTYMCQATNTLRPSGSNIQSEASGNATVAIRVRHKPGETKIEPSSAVAVSGKPFTLSCMSRPPGWPMPTYRWWRDGQEQIELGQQMNLTFQSAHISDEGTYYCQPRNELGKGSLASVYMTVHKLPVITFPLSPQSVRKAGDTNFRLTCKAHGKPRPKVRWYQNGQEIPYDSVLFKTIEEEDTEAFVVQSTLKFDGKGRKGSGLMPEDKGYYTCEFENGLGEVVKSGMLLRIEHAPIIWHNYNRMAFDVGQTAVLACKMQAYPEPKFEWFYRNRMVESDSVYGLNVTDQGEDVYAGMLSIRNITEDDYGDYTCRAWNEVLGDDKKTIIKLVKKSAPDAPVNLNAVAISSDTVTLTWNPGFNGGFPETEYIVTYKNMASFQPKNESCRSQNPCKIIGLESSTTYQFRVLALNPRGFSPYSEGIIVMTKVSLKDMPRAVDAVYDKERQVLLFHTDEPQNFQLIAKIEVRMPSADGWQHHSIVPAMQGKSGVHLQPLSEDFSDIRVLLCLQSNDSWCGDGRLAETFAGVSHIKEPTPSLQLIIIIALAGSGLLIVVLIISCCIWQKKKRKDKKDYEMESSNARPKQNAQPYFPETKEVDHPKSIYQPAKLQSPYHHLPAGPHHNQGYTYPPETEPNQCMTTDSHSDLWLKTGGDMGPETYQHYDTTLQGGYYYPEDYQPLTDDVMNMRNREHMSSTYYDVSGLPDPYALMDEDKQQHTAPFDESLESGYSTPNSRSRRVIREIIV